MVHSQEFYRQYQETYLKYAELYGSQVCVFLLKGSFYELYGIYDPATDRCENTVKEVANLLNLQLKTYPNDVSGNKTGYFGGVPDTTIHKWAGKLCHMGWTCVLIDQIKDDRGNVSERKVARVLSPGTHLEQASSDESLYVAAIWLQATSILAPPSYGIVSMEASTGQTHIFEGTATGTLQSWHADVGAQMCATFAPKEVILFWEGAGPLCPEEEQLRILFQIPSHVPLYLRFSQEDALSQPIYREEYLKSKFNYDSLMPFRSWSRLQGREQTEKALCRLLSYLEDHDTSLLKIVQIPEPWHPEECMQILNHAMEQLNISSPTGQLSVEQLFNRCITPIGKRIFKERLQSPLVNPQKISDSHLQIQWVLEQDKPTRRRFENCLRCMCDLSRIHRQLSRGQWSHAVAQQMLQTMQAAELLLTLLTNSPLMSHEAQIAFQTCRANLETLVNQEIVMTYDSEGDPYQNWLHPSKSQLTETAQKRITELRKTADQWLRDYEEFIGFPQNTFSFKTTDSIRYLLHITKTQQRTIVASAKGSSKFKDCSYKSMSSNYRVEHEELDQFHERTIAAEQAFTRAISYDISKACTEYCTLTRSFWQIIDDWTAQTDIAITHANVVDQYRLVMPQVEMDATEGGVQIENLRHPLIENQKTHVKYTSHNVSLGFNQSDSWLLYGINASGKSSLMKAIGIATVLAQTGLYVPATAMRIRPFRVLATRILNHDNIAQGMSSFTVEMSELREILRVADHQTLVLGDEVCAGTENVSGTAIVAASIEYLMQKKSRFVFATHLHDLLECDEIRHPNLKIWHLKVHYEAQTDTLIYDRSLCEGAGTTYYGLEVAKALHIPREVLDSAYRIRNRLQNKKGVEEAKKSHWNPAQFALACEHCKSQDRVEVHHIQHRADATNERNEDGTSVHDKLNLVTLCASCHDKLHASEIEVGPVIQTSKGEQRQIVEKPTQIKVKKGFTADELKRIFACIKANPGLHAKLLVVKLEHEENLTIKVAQLQRLMTNGKSSNITEPN